MRSGSSRKFCSRLGLGCVRCTLRGPSARARSCMCFWVCRRRRLLETVPSLSSVVERAFGALEACDWRGGSLLIALCSCGRGSAFREASQQICRLMSPRLCRASPFLDRGPRQQAFACDRRDRAAWTDDAFRTTASP